MSGPRVLTVGVLASPETLRGLAEDLAAELPTELAARFPGSEWEAVAVEAARHDPGASSRELVEAVRRRMLDEGWDLALALTDLPLRVGRRPVSAHASATHGVGLISIPALGALGRGRRLRAVALRLVEGLLGESVGRRGAGGGRDARMARRLRELGARRTHEDDDGSLWIVGALLRGNLRLLVGMVRANEPTRVILRLSRALFGAAGTGALAMVFTDIWRLADALPWLRLLALGLASIVVTTLVLVAVHGLWERSRDRAVRERVLLFNLATTITVTLAVVTLYVGLFVAALACAAALIPTDLLAAAVDHAVGVADYVRLACFTATLATIGGALGALVESDEAVRDAAYRSLADERTETGASA
jgi:uncharacterized membrane protein